MQFDRFDHLGTGHENRAGRCQKQHFPAPSGILDQIVLTPGNGSGGKGIGDEKSLELGFDYEQPFEFFPHAISVANTVPVLENRRFSL